MWKYNEQTIHKDKNVLHTWAEVQIHSFLEKYQLE